MASDGVVASKTFFTVVREMGNADIEIDAEGRARERSDGGTKISAQVDVALARVERF